mgnify:CR=1 FL=1
MSDYGLIDRIPIYAALVFGIQKMLPMMQSIYGAITKMRANMYQALIALQLILKNKKKRLKINKNKINFKREIKFKNIKFFNDIAYVINNHDLSNPYKVISI